MKLKKAAQPLFAASAIAILLLGAPPARAQDEFAVSAEVTDEEYEAAFDAYYADPTDVEASVRFARLAIARGEYETAAGTLERILLVAPDLAVLRAELGMIYARLGSHDVAKHHLQKAIASGDLGEAREERARRVLRQVEEDDSIHSFRGSLQLGVRYQSNATNGTDEDFVFSRGALVPATDAFDEEDDVNFFGLFNGHYAYDFQTQYGTRLEVDGLVYASKQISEDLNDLAVAQVKVGPSFQPAPADARGLRVQPYAVIRGVFLEDAAYSGSLGGGLHVTNRFNDQWRLDLDANAAGIFHNNTDERPQADAQDGLDARASAVLRYAPMNNVYLSLRGKGLLKDADADRSDYYQLGLMARVDVFYGAPGEITDGRWHSRVYAGFDYREYDEADPVVTPTKAREDEIFTVGAAQSIWFTDFDAVTAEASATFVHSNMRNFDRDNFSGILSYTRRF